MSHQPPEGAVVEMPDLCGLRRAARHRVDSALLTLLRMGVDFDRLVIESAGPGISAGAVVAQSPAPGTTLTRQTRVVLSIGGPGGLDRLPFALREDSEDDFRVDRLFALFDNPLHKLAFYIRQGGGFLALHPDEPLTARRWLEDIFDIPADPWPSHRWYAIARLVPLLHAISGTRDGLELAARAVFGLPVEDVAVRNTIAPIAGGQLIKLGESRGRLGFDAVLGGGVESAGTVEVTYGPVTLDVFAREATEAGRAERRALYRLVLPAHLAVDVRERWTVGDRTEGARVGDPAAPAVLGVCTYLGDAQRRAA